MKPTVLAVTSDLHCGSSVALCPPRIEQDDGGFYEASKAQRWLWQNWLAYWKRVAAVRKANRASLIEVFNGDLVDGTGHHGTVQMVGSGNPVTQAAVVDAAMHVAKGLSPDTMFFVRGTSSHTGPSSAHEERIAMGCLKDGMPVVKCPETGTASHWIAKMEIDGVRLDFRHHGRAGQRPHTRGSIANLLAFQIWTEHSLRGEPYPHIAVRSHMHQHWDTANAYPTRLIQTPSFQLATEYVHAKVTESAMADVGGIIIVVKDGSFTVEAVLFTPASPTVWRPK